LEHTALLIPTAFCTPPSREEQPVGPDIRERASIFLPDAFTNPGYLRFALKTTIAAMLCYVIYSALDWPGLATSVLTCIITALNTVGATKQKQVLRLLGASFGGLIALGSIIFLLPEIDSITAVTVLVAVVSAFGAWVSLASTRLAYFGLQTALAFYLAFIQDYTATTDLAPARDRALGVLLGLAVMWLVFDNLWPASAAKHMQRGLARNLRWLAELVTATDIPDRAAAIHRVRNLRDRIQGGMATVHGHADSVLFEIGSRDRKWQLTLRDAVLRLQATLRTLFVVEIAICQYRTQIAPGSRPPEVVEAQRAFDHALAERLLDAARSVDELQHVPPDERLSAAFERFEESIGPWVQSLTDPWQKTQVSGIRALMRQTVTLAESLGQHWTSTS
jgi:multidrug resistance protein MdtO